MKKGESRTGQGAALDEKGKETERKHKEESREYSEKIESLPKTSCTSPDLPGYSERRLRRGYSAQTRRR